MLSCRTMDSEDDLNGLRRWVRIMNDRGHASMFARETPDDLAIVERLTAQEWCKAVRAKYGLNADGVESNQDPKGVPDCLAYIDGARVSLELTELVDGQLLDQIRDAKANGQNLSAYEGEGFVRSQWDMSRFVQALTECIRKKDQKYQRNSNEVDVLIIHTDEPWLSPGKIDEYLLQSEFKPTKTIHSAYLLMTYVPGYSENWPVFRLF
jgi:hypothetical protein